MPKMGGAFAGPVYDKNGDELLGGGGGGGAPTTAAYVVLSLDGTLSNERVLTGTSGQIMLTDNGAGSTVVVSLPSNFTLPGSFSLPYRAITSLRTLDATDYTVDCTSGTFAVTLPTAVGITGRIYVIKNSGTGPITIDTTSSQTIDGSLTQTLAVQYSEFTVQSNGANWLILSS